MAITFDTSVDTSYNASVSSLTFSHTTSGTERLLVVNAGLWTDSGKTVTGVTYNGTAMTLVDNGAADANNNCYMYYLINPDSGTHDVVISASGTCDLWGASASYNGVNQLAPLGDTNKSNGSGDPLTGTVTTTEANSWIIMVNYGNGGGDGQTAAAGDTDPTEMLTLGKIRSATLPALTAGAPVYLSDTAGDLVVTQPSTTNFAIRVVGYAITAEDLFFNPSADYIVHV